MVAFGRAAPLHAARLCEKLGINPCPIPPAAGLRSAIGFLKAPFGYEAFAFRITRLSSFDPIAINALLADLKITAEGFVRVGTAGSTERGITAFMRYVGQGWEIPLPLPDRDFGLGDADDLRCNFQAVYAQFCGRAIDGLEDPEIEIVTFSVTAQATRPAPDRHALTLGRAETGASLLRPVIDPALGEALPTAIIDRAALKPDDRLHGPAVMVERETSTAVTSPFDVVMQDDGSLILFRKGA